MTGARVCALSLARAFSLGQREPCQAVAAAGDHVMCACLQNLTTPMCGTRIGLGDPRNHNPEHHIMALLILPSSLLRRRTGNLIW